MHLKNKAVTTITRVALIAGVALTAAAIGAFADTFAPQLPPPQGNVDTPLNTGATVQVKKTGGSIQINGGFGISGGPFVYNSGTVAQGQILAALDATGTVGWVSTTTLMGTAGAFISSSCPSAQFGRGIDVNGAIICDYVVPMATVTVNTDEQVLIHLKPNTAAWITNTTRNGASLVSTSYADIAHFMPSDGKALALAGLTSGNGNATILSACPVGWVPGQVNGAMGDRMCIYQQPTSPNYETIVAIWDGASGAHSWSFTLGYAISGCMNKYATNYNPAANVDNGSCTYNALTVACTPTPSIITRSNSAAVTWSSTVTGGPAAYSYQWQFPNGSGVYSNVVGTNSPTYSYSPFNSLYAQGTRVMKLTVTSGAQVVTASCNALTLN